MPRTRSGPTGHNGLPQQGNPLIARRTFLQQLGTGMAAIATASLPETRIPQGNDSVMLQRRIAGRPPRIRATARKSTEYCQFNN